MGAKINVCSRMILILGSFFIIFVFSTVCVGELYSGTHFLSRMPPHSGKDKFVLKNIHYCRVHLYRQSKNIIL